MMTNFFLNIFGGAAALQLLCTSRHWYSYNYVRSNIILILTKIKKIFLVNHSQTFLIVELTDVKSSVQTTILTCMGILNIIQRKHKECQSL